MDNPFKKRATEYFEDPASLILVLSPEPLRRFFEGNASAYYDRLVTVVGTPGSGKTSIARLVEFDTVIALLRTLHSKDHKDLAQTLGECDMLSDSRPKVLACRLPTTSDVRNIWELPYSVKIRHGLLRSLIQARAVLGWLRKLEGVGVDVARIRIVAREQSEVQAGLIRTEDPLAFRAHARSVEEKVFRIITALVPPSESELATSGPETTYEAFQIIESFVVPEIIGIQGGELTLRPLCIIDDAHELHPDQYSEIDIWLKNREIKVARWLMTRVDAVSPEALRKALQTPESGQFGSTKNRDWILKLMQRGSAATEKRAYRATVKDIARRYIDQMPVLRRRGVQLDNCLAAALPELTASQFKDLEKSVLTAAKTSGFSHERLEQIRSWIPPNAGADERLALTRILIHREMRRTPQADLFATEAPTPEALPEPRNVGTKKVNGASLQLFHEFGKPYYYSCDRLADASGENIEQFIHLAGVLVDQIETRVVRGRAPNLDAKAQNSILVENARGTIRRWNFPHSSEVRRLIEFIVERCLLRTLAPNAPLDDGANAFGIQQSDMERFQRDGGKLVPVLHYALAYNAITLHESYECKRKTWCLFQLGGLPILANGLTFSKGGFCEGTLSELIQSVTK
ncbi:MAG: hypothetical protein HY801_10240 [Candidatus Lindowbacteria bacterium]|nr:hypothetical protein [Candidatus Lindowbacteria bacterium]